MIPGFTFLLPPEGLLVRDFLQTAFTYLAHEVEAQTLMGNVVRVDDSPEGVAQAIKKITDIALQQLHEVGAPALSGNDMRWTARKWVLAMGGSFDDAGKGTRAVMEYGLEKYKAIISPKEIYNLFAEGTPQVSQREWMYGDGRLAAFSLMKANYYELARSFGPFIEGIDFRMGIHSFTLALIGSILSRSGTFREQRRGIYVFPMEVGALDLCLFLRDHIIRTCFYRLAPECVFRLYTALEFGDRLRSGWMPTKISIVQEGGQRPAVLKVETVNLSEYKRFVDEIVKHPRSLKWLSNLLASTLRYWGMPDPTGERRTLVSIGMRIAFLITEALGHAIPASAATHSIARMTSASASKQIEDALQKLGDLKEVPYVIHDILRALEEAMTL